ncbi:hypothetical protein PUNSTDRAFT_137894 [Punctularia strigosozonata HHB-11173 SS5]|uniref:Uncharacterized protein n=1 Tax=Punctularia strigosozonata (strain HHB-11173) TaxID=741275 RepID=R7S5F4_PUNST|nr:uncharacterized protein PUNSTDRAFT_137894 [Punctularia strigosozonata HHB-11173 SS5]EIN05214.1 hypothetical protein PUNSTDRAFT_137894 [Punctularia strigosozonata HHB-11173 SS5]
MQFDLVVLITCGCFLWQFRRPSVSGSAARTVKMMLYGGVLYFIILAVFNLMNLIFYKYGNEGLQSAGISLQYTMTWVMSQRILIRLQEASRKAGVTETILITNAVTPGPPINRTFRAQVNCQRNATADEELGEGRGSKFSSGEGARRFNPDIELPVRVRVDKSVKVQWDSLSSTNVSKT